MTGWRWEIEARVGPAREGLVGGGAVLCVRVRLSDEGVEDPQPDAFTDLPPSHARWLAEQLFAAAAEAERQSGRASYWKPAK